MKSTGIGTYILITILILLVFGLISVGDVLSAVFYVLLGIAVLILAGVLFLQYKLRRIRRQMEQNGESARSYSWGSRSSRQPRQDGEVTVQQTRTTIEKVVSYQVGDYVEYEDIREERTEETTK